MSQAKPEAKQVKRNLFRNMQIALSAQGKR